MVDANGCVLQVNDQEHPDLFWALRGGGGSFGICTSFRFRTQEIKTVGFVEVSWRHQDLKALYRNGKSILYLLLINALLLHYYCLQKRQLLC